MSDASLLRRVGLSGQLADHITNQIVDGTLAPGQLLPTEREVAKQFAVSVGVVREAIKTIAAMGLLDVRHGVGSFVTPRELWNTSTPMMLLVRNESSSVMDVYDVRAPLEIASVEWAAERATNADLQALDAAIERMRLSVTNVEAFVAADVAFHVALATAAHNRILLSVLQPLIEPIQDCMLRIVHLPIVKPRALLEHAEITAAVQATLVTPAREAMRRHLQTTRDELAMLIASSQRDADSQRESEEEAP